MLGRIRRQVEKLNKTCVMISLMHWIISFFSDRLIFSYVSFDFSTGLLAAKSIIMIGAKVLFLPVLMIFWHTVIWLIKKADRRFVRFFVIYGFVNAAILLLTWPGIWRMDEFGILSNALKLQPVFWQNYVTSIFYIYSLMIIPIPPGVIVMQIGINGFIVAYVMSRAEKLVWKKQTKLTYGLLVPFLFLPVLDSNLYPMRMSVYAFLELLLIWVLVEGAYRKELTYAQEVLIIIVGSIVTMWRTEAIYYLMLLPIIITIIFLKHIKKQQLTQVLAGYLCLTIVLTGAQFVGDKLTSGNEYDLTSVVLPIIPLVEAAYEDDAAEAKALLDQIDQVINVDVAYAGAKEGRSGISLYWGEQNFKRNYTNAEYSIFKQAYYKLICRYPFVFLKERATCFVQSTTLLEDTTQLFTKENVPNYEVFRAYPLSKPISNHTRTSVIKMLEWRGTTYEELRTGYGLVYSCIMPMILLTVFVIALLCKRKWQYACIICLPICKVPLVFLTAPSRLFMYYYSIYLIGWFLFFVWIFAKLSRRGEL